MCIVTIKKHDQEISFEAKLCSTHSADGRHDVNSIIFEAYVAILSDIKSDIQKLPRDDERVKLFEDHIMKAHSVLDKVAKFEKSPG